MSQDLNFEYNGVIKSKELKLLEKHLMEAILRRRPVNCKVGVMVNMRRAGGHS